MQPSDRSSALAVALVGNPNTGKSTLFGALVGSQQRVGNYPGVTVEKKIGRFKSGDRCYEVIDLPGLYSLAPRGRDEMVVVDSLLGRQPGSPPIDLVVCLIDASNLKRNLYLLSQILGLGLPTIVALNKLDLAQSQGVSVEVERFRARLVTPVVVVQANRRLGINDLKEAIDLLADEVGSESGLPLRFGSGTQASCGCPSTRCAHCAAGGRPAKPIERPEIVFPECFEKEVAELTPLVERACGCPHRRIPAQWLARRLLLDSNGYLRETLLGGRGRGRRRHGPGGHGGGRGEHRGQGRGPACHELNAALDAAQARLREQSCPIPEIEPEVCYAWADRVLEGVLQSPDVYRISPSDRIDRVLTHPVGGTAVFLAVMFVVFQAVFSWATPLMDLIDAGVGALGQAIVAALAGTSYAGGAVESLLVGGVLGGVGSVLIFLPQILILFFFIALLEQCGYMARAAFLMDKLMARVGLNGKSFIPLLCSYACAVPGIMATRVISNERNRLVTILVAPLMTCSARLPIYTMLIAAFVPARAYCGGLVNLQGLTMVGLYLLGVVTAVVVAALLKRTLLRGPATPLLMEMPSYEWPSACAVLFRMIERGWLFVRAAGTIILAVSILVWAALYFPRPASIESQFAPRRAVLEASLSRMSPESPLRNQIETQLAQLDFDVATAYQRQSILARLGRLIEPVVRPLGWDWRIGSSVLASFPAREAVIATMGVIFSHDDQFELADAPDEDARLVARLQHAHWEGTNRPLFNLPVALSIMVFYALCAQCAATLAVMRRETGSWRWPLFAFGYMTILAYLGALVTYQVGMWIGCG